MIAAFYYTFWDYLNWKSLMNARILLSIKI
jgi:hypothetical protein